MCRLVVEFRSTGIPRRNGGPGVDHSDDVRIADETAIVLI
jgi:hypothetical protein